MNRSYGSMILEISHLQMVDAVARAGTVTRAAEELHVTQPAVSHRLRELEQRLGTTLFTRAGRRMRLTPEGVRLLESARRVLTELEAIEAELAQYRAGARGTLRVATECYLCYGWLPAICRRLESERPGIDIRVVPNVTRDPLPALLDRTVDVAIVYSLPRDSRVMTRELFTDELVAVVPERHPLARKPYLVARDFELETLVCHYAESDRSVFDREVLDVAAVKPHRVLEVQVTGAVIEMVRAGMGLAVLPLWALPAGRRESGLRVLRVTKKGLFRTWHVAVLADQVARPPTSALVRLLEEELGGQGRQTTATSPIRPAIGTGRRVQVNLPVKRQSPPRTPAGEYPTLTRVSLPR
jgi:LysR family transcriptional regulator, regulator for metE and metH